ncbi:cation:proton antiporter [Glutamicibacter sp. X7]
MDFFLVLIMLLFATVLIVGVSERIGLPYPILMLVFAVLAGFLPFVPVVHVPPELILPIFLPPLLFATAQRSSWSVFRFRWKSLIRLAVVLIVVTAGAVAATAWAFSPLASIPLAIALGAIVAPPDPVAVDAIATKVKIPRRLTSILETEGLFNDAMAIVIFQLAVTATVNGTEVGWEIIPQFLIGAAIAVVLGFAMAWLIGALNRFVPNMVARCAATLVAPYAVYLLAEELHASGVVAVVVTALELGRRARPQDASERLTRNSFWEVLEMLATGLAFGLMGFEMNSVITEEGADLIAFIPGVLAVSVVVIAVRAIWMFATYYLPQSVIAGRRMTAKDSLVLTWCGMRGLATLALALALPTTHADGAPIEGRNFVVACACGVLVATLVVPGLTLPALMRVLKLPGDGKLFAAAQRKLAKRAEQRALEVMRESPELERLPQDFRDSMTRRLKTLHTLLEQGEADVDETRREELGRLRAFVAAADTVQSRALNAARNELMQARNERGVDPHMVDEIVERLDQRTVVLDR